MSKAVAVIFAGLFFLTGSNAFAVGLEAVAGIVGGVATTGVPGPCSTYGAPAPIGSFFGSAAGFFVPSGGISACGYGGSINDLSAVTGPLTASNSLNGAILGNPGFAGTYSGSSDARAGYNSLGADAHGTITGGVAGSPVAVANSAGAAFFDDLLTVTSPEVASAADGFVRYRFGLEGSLSTVGTPTPFLPQTAGAVLSIQHQGGSVLQLVQVSSTVGSDGLISALDGSTAGWVSGPGTISGSGEYGSTIHGSFDTVFDLPISFGSPFELEAGLLAWVDGMGDADFFTTATFEGVDVFDANHNPITDFTLTSASATPEPVSIALCLSGLLLCIRRRSAKKVR